MKRYIFLLLLMLCVKSESLAQNTTQRSIVAVDSNINEIEKDTSLYHHTLSFSLGGVYSNLSVKHADISPKGGGGMFFRLAYTYKFTPNWGLSVGMGYSITYLSIPFKNALETPLFDIEGKDYILETDLDFTEKQVFHQWSIPILANYEVMLSPVLTLVSKVGFTLSIPLSSRYQVNEGKASISAYYPQYDLRYDDLPFMGYGSYTDFSAQGKILSRVSMAATVECGVNILDKGFFSAIYVGLYADFGLNSLLRTSPHSLFSDAKSYHGLLGTNGLRKATLQHFGLKVELPLWRTL